MKHNRLIALLLIASMVLFGASSAMAAAGTVTVKPGSVKCLAPSRLLPGGSSPCQITYIHTGAIIKNARIVATTADPHAKIVATAPTINPDHPSTSYCEPSATIPWPAGPPASRIPCAASFKYTAPSTRPVSGTDTITFHYKDGKGNHFTTTLPVILLSNVSAGPLTCNSPVIWGDEVTCSVKITNNNPTKNIASFTVTPSISPTSAGTADGSPTKSCSGGIIPKAAGTCTVTFKFKKGTKKPADGTATISASYTDSNQDSLTITPFTANFVSPVTLSGIRCDPDEAVPGGSMSCNAVFSNISSQSITLHQPNVTIGGHSVTPTGCADALAPNATCTLNFTKTIGSSPENPLKVVVSPSAGKFTKQTKKIPVFASGKPHIQSNPILCDQLPVERVPRVGPPVPRTTTCRVLFRNLGVTTATGVSITPSAALGTISNTSQMVCDGSSSETKMSDGKSCSLSFTYTAPSSPSTDVDSISVAYSDTQGSYPAFLRAQSIVLQPAKPNASFTASVIPNTGNVMPAKYSGYKKKITIQFQFMNNTESNISNQETKLLVIRNGKQFALSRSIVSTADSSCVTANTVDNGSGCILAVNFTPDNFNGFKVGDRVKIYAWLTSASANSQVASWDFSIGKPPIFSEVATNNLFATDNTFKGAFIFGNSSGSALTDLRAVRLFLPAGFSPAESSACSSLISNYNNIAACTAGSLASGAYCYACFKANSDTPSHKPKYYTFEGQLVYHDSVTTAKRLVNSKAKYRKLTLKNKCPGPVWPAFVSGAAYYYCEKDSDCPLKTKCYKAGHQCMVPPESASKCTGKGYNVPAGFEGGGCSKGCLDVNVKSSVCPNQSICNPDNGLCFWKLPKPSGMVKWKLPSDTTATVTIPNTPLIKAGNWSAVWSGGLIARTGCVYDSQDKELKCETGYCPLNVKAADHSCKRGVAPLTPATQAEFTFLYRNHDYYDVEIINGFTIPISMKPTGYSGTPVSTHPHTCNVTGEAIASSNVCTWDFTMKSYDLTASTSAAHSAKYKALHTYVVGGGATCVPGGTACTSPAVCGLSQTNSVIPKVGGIYKPKFTCGKLIGFWSTNQICGSNSSLKYKYDSTHTLNCAKNIPHPDGPTLANWLGCAGGAPSGNSCYGSLPGSGHGSGSCCGCAYWSGYQESSGKITKGVPSAVSYITTLFPTGSVLYPNGSNDYCKNYSSGWVTDVLSPGLIWMKKGCTSLYTYAYDDPTSTFTCSSESVVGGQLVNPAGKVNKQNYTITFCPGSSTGTVNGNAVEVPTPSS